jgi:outer membrane receptor protein involved in Fe transport
MQYMRPEQFKAQAVYRQPLRSISDSSAFSGAYFVATLNVVHEGGGYWDLDVNMPNPMDTARRVNARVGIQTNRWSLMLNSRNLTDEDYHLWSDAERTHYRRVDPRYYFAEFTYRYL